MSIFLHLGMRCMRVDFSCCPPALPTEPPSLPLTCSPFASSNSRYLMQGLYTCLWLTNISFLHWINTQYIHGHFIVHDSDVKNLRDFHGSQGGWHVSSTCVCEWLMWSGWFASLHSYPRPGITAGSRASALPLNTFRTESQAVFYIFNGRKKTTFFRWATPSGALSKVPIFLELLFIKWLNFFKLLETLPSGFVCAVEMSNSRPLNM